MLPKGYSMEVPWPPNSGRVVLKLKGEIVQTFPYGTSDSAIASFARLHSKGVC